MCVSAWSNLAGLGAGSQGHWAAERGAGEGPGTAAPRQPLPLPPPLQPQHLWPEPGGGSRQFHGQREQAKVCPLPVRPAEQGRREPSRCPTNSRRPWVVSSLVASQRGGLLQTWLMPASTFTTALREGACPPCHPAPLCWGGDGWSSLLPHQFSLCIRPGARPSLCGLRVWLPAAAVTSQAPGLTPERPHATSHRGGVISTGVGCAP